MVGSLHVSRYIAHILDTNHPLYQVRLHADLNSVLNILHAYHLLVPGMDLSSEVPSDENIEKNQIYIIQFYTIETNTKSYILIPIIAA